MSSINIKLTEEDLSKLFYLISSYRGITANGVDSVSIEKMGFAIVSDNNNNVYSLSKGGKVIAEYASSEDLTHSLNEIWNTHYKKVMPQYLHRVLRYSHDTITSSVVESVTIYTVLGIDIDISYEDNENQWSAVISGNDDEVETVTVRSSSDDISELADAVVFSKLVQKALSSHTTSMSLEVLKS